MVPLFTSLKPVNFKNSDLTIETISQRIYQVNGNFQLDIESICQRLHFVLSTLIFLL